MGRTAIVTDSTGDVPPHVADALGISVLPVTVRFGDQEFKDGIDITPPEFFRRLREADELPTTSQPSAGEFVETYRELSRSADSIVSIHISAELSGTIASAHAAKTQHIPSTPVHIVDTRSVSMGHGLLVLASAQLAKKGIDAPEIVERIQALIPKTSILFVVDTLDYLHAGGRIGSAERLLGSILDIKPILHVAEGRIDALAKARTKRKAVARMLDIMSDRVRHSLVVHAAVIQADAAEEAARLKEKVETAFPCIELHTCDLCPSLSVHTGPGTVAVAFYGGDA